MLTRNQIEPALDHGQLFVRMKNGNLWRVRRNGRTQTWKRDHARFRIPIKYGLYGYGQITETNNLASDEFVIQQGESADGQI